MKKITLSFIALALIMGCTSGEKKEAKPTINDEDVMSIPSDSTPVEAVMAADATPIAPVIEPVMDATPVVVTPDMLPTNEERAMAPIVLSMEAMK